MPKRDVTREYLVEALRLAKRDLPGWAFAMLQNEARARVGGKAKRKPKEPVDKDADIVPSSGPRGAQLAFVGASPGRVDAARGQSFTGPVGETFRDSYLSKLSMDACDVIKTNAVPIVLTDDDGRVREPTDQETEEWRGWLAKELDRLQPIAVVALGQTAKRALGDRADFVLPHPAAVRRFGNKGEVGRKLRRIQKAVILAQRQPATTQTLILSKDTFPTLEAARKWITDHDFRAPKVDETEESWRFRQRDPGEFKSGSFRTIELRGGVKAVIGRPKEKAVKESEVPIGLRAPIIKADEEKQIVYGVVLSSYGKDGAGADAHNDWMPPGEIEKTAHDWFRKSRKIGISHPGMRGFKSGSDSEAVESHIEEYPDGERAKAMRGEPHKVIKRKFGTDVAYSGDWILGAKLGDNSWAEFKRGEINAFSPEGLGLKTPAAPVVMPEITFVDPTGAGTGKD